MQRNFSWLFSLLLCFLLLTPQAAWAHPLSTSFSELKISSSGVDLAFSIDELSIIELLPESDKNDDKLLDDNERNAASPEIGNLVMTNLTVQLDGQIQSGMVQSIEETEKKGKPFITIHLFYPDLTAGATLKLQDDFYTSNNISNYVNLISIRAGQVSSEALLKGSERTWEQVVKPEWLADNAASNAVTDGESSAADGESSAAHETPSSWWSFFTLGMEHILFGYDHLLFLFALILCRQTFRQYLAIITSFTVAHSITLTLAVFGYISVPEKFIEIAVAISICWVALENIFRENVNHRWTLTFFFGLVHGMGFAGIMQEMTIPKSHLVVSLLSFNLGIETVQLLLVGIILPILTRLQVLAQYKRGVSIASSVIVALGGYWLLERILG